MAGLSVEYYKRLERGNAGRAHLFDLARAANRVTPRRPRPTKQRIRPAVQRILDQIGTPAIVRNARVHYSAQPRSAAR